MKYSKELTEKICKHLKIGNTITTTCEAVGIAKSTFYEWMEKKSDFSDAIKKAQSTADKKVENALFKMATGTFEYIERHYETTVIDKLKLGTLKKTIKKTLAPNITAQIFYLKNRNPDEWRDQQDIEHSGEIKHVLSLKGLKNSLKKYKKNAD